MKIAVPTRENRFSTHFGGADAFALYTVDESTREVGPRQMVAPPEHGRGVFPTWLQQLGTTVVLAGGMGPRAADIFASHGISVTLGVAGDDPDSLVQQYLAGTLESNGELCHEHGFHDCGHHEARSEGCGDHHRGDS
jgi:predicted Fe-Mo cluster-binding NifX family protein